MFGTNYWSLDKKEDPIWLKNASIKLIWCLMPRRCHSTGKLLWLTSAYRTERIWTGPGEPISEYRWYSKNEFLILKLKYGV